MGWVGVGGGWVGGSGRWVWNAFDQLINEVLRNAMLCVWFNHRSVLTLNELLSLQTLGTIFRLELIANDPNTE